MSNKQGKHHCVNDPGVNALIEAIFLQARNDYVNALVRLAERPNDETARYIKYEVEQFFKSSWAEELAQTQICADWIIGYLTEEAERRINDTVHDQDNEE